MTGTIPNRGTMYRESAGRSDLRTSPGRQGQPPLIPSLVGVTDRLTAALAVR